MLISILDHPRKHLLVGTSFKPECSRLPTALLEDNNCTLVEVQNILVNVNKHLLHVGVGSKQTVNCGEYRKGFPYFLVGVEKAVEGFRKL